MMKVLLTENQIKYLIEMTTAEINAEVKAVNTAPTELQKEKGNYKMGHIRVKGMTITIENPKGSKRTFKDSEGNEGYVIMKNHYGYFTKSVGKDGDAVDVFIGPNPEDFETVYVVDQNNKKGNFDESKVMLGFNSKKEAKDAYLSNFSKGWKGFRVITGVSLRLFKKWLYRDRKQQKPFADYVEIQKKKLEENRLINEDVFADKSLVNQKKKTVGLTYNQHAKRNSGNLSSFDMLNTDKMEQNNDDTYEVPLKGGIMSYNITSIKGEAVMHYFKNKFSNGGDSAKIKAGKDEYDLIMEDEEFKRFMNVFNAKVNRVINHCITNFKNQNNEFAPSKVSIYPVPSRSNFNKTMAEIMSRMTLGGLPVRVANADILKKDLRKLQKDEDFINKNKNFFNGKMSQQSSQNGLNNTVSSFLDRDINKFGALNKAKKYIDNMNSAVAKILTSWQNYKQTNSQKTLKSLAKNYMAYYDAMKECIAESGYENPLNDNGEMSNLRMDTVAKALKYTKGPSVEGRSASIWKLIKPLMRNVKSPITNKAYEPVDVNYWEPQKFEIKNLTNGERMGLKNYYNPNEDLEFIQNEINEIKGGVLVIFDDNISGGATLSDVCYQFKELGVEYLIPITFGEMSTKWTMNRLPLSMPTNDKGEVGKFNY